MLLFLTSSADQVLADIVTHLPQKPSDYRVAFITTAAECYPGDQWWVTADWRALTDQGFKVTEFTLTGLGQVDVRKKLADKNLIFVAGGNTFYLLDHMLKSGFDEVIKEKFKQNIPYIGSSAGAMVVGRRIDLVSTIDDRSKAPDLTSDGLGIIDLALLPHWGSPDFKAEYRQGFDTLYTDTTKIIPLTNHQYLLVEDHGYQIIQV